MRNEKEETTGLAVRCTNCRNRTGIDGARCGADGAVSCLRCFNARVTLTAREGTVIEILGGQ